jgi:HAD superfamily hydrolase (TIGR01484 family)
MKPLTSLTAAEARRLRGVVFDLDDTLLDHGALGEQAYSALFRLRDTGLRLIVCTGRPSGWGEVLVRMWPVDAIVTENGAVGYIRSQGRAVVALTPQRDRAASRRELEALGRELCDRWPPAALADDNDARWTDVTIDIGEHRSLPEDSTLAMRSAAEARGVRTFQSSVHLHLTREPYDKASGTIALLALVFGEDPTSARRDYGFIGDSENDAAPFAAFETTFGVANVSPRARSLSIPPRFVASAKMGLGFAEIARELSRLRGDSSAVSASDRDPRAMP